MGEADGESESIERLRRSEELFARAFLLNPMPMVVTNGETERFMAANEAFTTLTGYFRAEIIGATSAELELWPDRGERGGVTGALRASGHAGPFHATVRVKDGREIPCRVSFRMLEVAGERHILSVLVPD